MKKRSLLVFIIAFLWMIPLKAKAVAIESIEIMGGNEGKAGQSVPISFQIHMNDLEVGNDKTLGI